jgi:hypothetical protein
VFLVGWHVGGLNDRSSPVSVSQSTNFRTSNAQINYTLCLEQVKPADRAGDANCISAVSLRL